MAARLTWRVMGAQADSKILGSSSVFGADRCSDPAGPPRARAEPVDQEHHVE